MVEGREEVKRFGRRESEQGEERRGRRNEERKKLQKWRKLGERARRSEEFKPHLPTSHLSFLLDPSHLGETKEKKV
jgi:hypothetical protein